MLENKDKVVLDDDALEAQLQALMLEKQHREAKKAFDAQKEAVESAIEAVDADLEALEKRKAAELEAIEKKYEKRLEALYGRQRDLEAQNQQNHDDWANGTWRPPVSIGKRQEQPHQKQINNKSWEFAKMRLLELGRDDLTPSQAYHQGLIDKEQMYKQAREYYGVKV